MSGPGSTGNVIAAVASLVVPGLGQLLQGRPFWAVFWLVFTGVVWVLSLGCFSPAGHVFACLHAALFRPGPGA